MQTLPIFFFHMESKSFTAKVLQLHSKVLFKGKKVGTDYRYTT